MVKMEGGGGGGGRREGRGNKDTLEHYDKDSRMEPSFGSRNEMKLPQR